MSETTNSERPKANNRGKETQRKIASWFDAFEEVIRENPCGIKISEGRDGLPRAMKRKTTPRSAWVVEIFDPKKETWEFSMFFNIDKADTWMRFTHTMAWCLSRLKAEKEFFDNGNYDKANCRVRNVMTSEFIHAAVLSL